MAEIVKLTATDGTPIEFVNETKGSGGMKDCYFSPDKKYVCLVFRAPKHNNPQNKDRMETVCGLYRQRIFEREGGDYWRNLFVWPDHVFIWNGKLGITAPFYKPHFFFQTDGKIPGVGPKKGVEKEGKWFASALHRNKFLSDDQKGNWLNSVHMCLKICRAVRRLHAAGLAHGDISYKNILVDPALEEIAVIDNDGMVVPGKFPPDVVGTPDFIAPEVLQTKNLPLTDPNRKLPSIQTDRHALAVLIYMYLLNRHPLRGGKVNDLDPTKDEELTMGSKALFIEHPTDKSNRPKVDQLRPSELPQGDVTKRPYTICGPYLKELFDRAFIDGLHDPSKRPTAEDWETALVKTTDLMQPCQNPNCEAHWFVFDNSTKPRCPFCGKEYHGQLPVLNLYNPGNHGTFRDAKHRLMVYDKQSLYMWHVNNYIMPNERTKPEDKKPVGDFHFHNGKWILINRRLNSLYDKDVDKKIEIGQYVELTEGKKILLSTEDGGRLIIVQLVNN